jgi:hypothetical protein
MICRGPQALPHAEFGISNSDAFPCWTNSLMIGSPFSPLAWRLC